MVELFSFEILCFESPILFEYVFSESSEEASLEQEIQAVASGEVLQISLFRIMQFMMVNSFLMQATRATFLPFPRASRDRQNVIAS